MEHYSRQWKGENGRSTAMGDDVEESVDERSVDGSLTAALLSKKSSNSSDPLLSSSSFSFWHSKPWRNVALCFFFPALGGFLFGYDIGATSAAIVLLKSPILSGTHWYDLTPSSTGLVVSGSLVGALIGSGVAFWIGDSIGRRKELITASFFYFFGAFLLGFAPSLLALMVGRLVFGMGIGLAMHAAPMYIAETVPACVRGTLISLKEALIVGGILAGYFAGYGAIDVVGGWRFIYGFAAPVAAVMGIGMMCLPPSPRWLLLRSMITGVTEKEGKEHNFKEEAMAALVSLRGGSIDDEDITDEMTEMLLSVQQMAAPELDTCRDPAVLLPSTNGNPCNGLLHKSSLKALTAGLGLVFFQQVTGQPSMLYYAASILRAAGFEAASSATKASIAIGSFKLVMTAIAILAVDKVGRRPLLLVGISGIVLSLFMLSYTLKCGSIMAMSSVFSLLLYVGCYQLSFGPITWLMISEIFPLRTRGRALSIASILNFVTNSIVTLAFPTAEHILGPEMLFFLFGIMAVIALLFVAFNVPETVGLTLEEIEAELNKS